MTREPRPKMDLLPNSEIQAMILEVLVLREFHELPGISKNQLSYEVCMHCVRLRGHGLKKPQVYWSLNAMQEAGRLRMEYGRGKRNSWIMIYSIASSEDRSMAVARLKRQGLWPGAA